MHEKVRYSNFCSILELWKKLSRDGGVLEEDGLECLMFKSKAFKIRQQVPPKRDIVEP